MLPKSMASGLGRLDGALIHEALAYGCPTIAGYISIHNMVAWMVSKYASDVQRAAWMNKLASMMDEQAISMGVGLQLFDEGNPTPFGLLTILIAGMLVLVAFKVVTDWLGEPADNPVVRLEISYMPDGASERTTVFIEIELYQEEAPLHVENFLLLVEDFRYDFTTFHRVIDGFMAAPPAWRSGWCPPRNPAGTRSAKSRPAPG